MVSLPSLRRSTWAATPGVAATSDRPAAVLTGPATAVDGWSRPARRLRPADTSGMVRVSLAHRPLTASAALVWSGDLPRLLQQMLFDTADSLTPSPAQVAGLVSLPSA